MTGSGQAIDAERLAAAARRAGECLRSRGLLLVTAESCTGGWVAQAVTAVAGSSGWFERGFVTYSNLAKQQMLGVAERTLVRYGAVSEEVVAQMARGALARSAGQVAVAVSGVAGPGGGSAAKPVGMVCLAWLLRDGPARCVTHRYAGDRAAIRAAAVRDALEGVCALLADAGAG